MISDKFGNPVYQINDLVELIYAGSSELDKVIVENTEEIAQFEKNSNYRLNKVDNTLEAVSLQEFDSVCQSDWFIPDEYKRLDIEAFLVSICPEQNYSRLIEELAEYKSRNFLPLLKVLKYLVDTFRANGIIWGVGRGSSVASYVLYLLDIHRIDSVKYNLDWREFLR